MEISPWIRFLDIYELSYGDNPAKIRLTARQDFDQLLSSTGVYLIADDGNLIYVGQAGGRSIGSSFGARVRKHGLKALGVTKETVPGCGIADTRRWSEYRSSYLQATDRQELSGILDKWRVRMLVLPNQSSDQRRVIDLIEQVAALVFDRIHHAGVQPIEMPPCNAQQLAASLLDLLGDLPRRLDEATRTQTRDLWEVDLADEIALIDDEDWYDEAFESRCDGRPELVQLYLDLLREIRIISEEPIGRAVGLSVAYTDTDIRDFRVRGSFEGFKVLMRITRRGDGFKVWMFLDHDRPEIQNLNPRREPHDRLRTSFQYGGDFKQHPGCSAQRVGQILRLALVAAPVRWMPFAREHAQLQRPTLDVCHATQWLRSNLAEEMPTWLRNFRRGDDFQWDAFVDSRIVYYPGSGTDGQPVAIFGSSGAAHCFVYVDYGLTRQEVERQLDDAQHGFKGYRSYARINIEQDQLTPEGWVPHLKPEDPAPYRDFVKTEPYSFIEILEKLPDFDAYHGPERLAILFLASDGVAAYDALFCQVKRSAPFAVVLQDHGFGDNYTSFGAGGLLHSIAIRTSRLPEILLVATSNTTPWPDFQHLPDADAHRGGMHGFTRSLFVRNNTL